jgi:tungstate transport system substrate-binding protein
MVTAKISVCCSCYRDIGGGMGQALNTASAIPAYTLSDRGTWLSFANKGPLVIAVEGDPKLINRYDVIQLNPEKSEKEKLDDARRLADWLSSADGPASYRRL